MSENANNTEQAFATNELEAEDKTRSETAENQVREAEINYGKFTSAEALLNAYNALEAEFTKRCQKLKQLETQVNNKVFDKQAQEELFKLALNDEELLNKYIFDNAQVYDMVIARYLLSLSNKNGVFVMPSNTGVSALTPVKKPKSLEDAKKLADLMLTK